MASTLIEFRESTNEQLIKGLEALKMADRKQVIAFADDFNIGLPKVGKTEDLRTVVGAVFTEALKLSPVDAWEFFRKQKPLRRGGKAGLPLEFIQEGVPRDFQVFSSFDKGVLNQRSWGELEPRHRQTLVEYYTETGGRRDFREYRLNEAFDKIVRPQFNKGLASTDVIATAAKEIRAKGMDAASVDFTPESAAATLPTGNRLSAKAKTDAKEKINSVSFRDAHLFFSDRPARAQALDRARTSKRVAPAKATTKREKRQQQAWLRHPGRSDFQGVDTRGARPPKFRRRGL